MPAVICVQVPGHVQRYAVGCGARRPPQTAGHLAARGADRAEGPYAVFRRSHRGRTGLRPVPTEWRQQQLTAWLPPLPGEQRDGPSQYPTDEMLRKVLKQRFDGDDDDDGDDDLSSAGSGLKRDGFFV